MTVAPKPSVYRLTPLGIAELSASIFFNFPRRSLGKDAIRLLDMYQPRPTLSGIELLPRDEPFVIVANHYHRNGLWIGWIGALLCEAISAFRPVDVPIRIVVTDRQRIQIGERSLTLPLSGLFLRRITKLWGMIRMPSDPKNTIGRATVLKHLLRLLASGEPILFFPEGDRGSAAGLVEALPGTGTFLALASRRARIIPVGFWEEGPRLCGQVGTALTLDSSDDTTLRQQVIASIKHLLPTSFG